MHDLQRKKYTIVLGEYKRTPKKCSMSLIIGKMFFFWFPTSDPFWCSFYSNRPALRPQCRNILIKYPKSPLSPACLPFHFQPSWHVHWSISHEVKIANLYFIYQFLFNSASKKINGGPIFNYLRWKLPFVIVLCMT